MIETENKPALHKHLADRLACAEITVRTAEQCFKDNRNSLVGTQCITIFTADKMIKAMRHAAFDFYSQLIDEGQKPLADNVLKKVKGK